MWYHSLCCGSAHNANIVVIHNQVVLLSNIHCIQTKFDVPNIQAITNIHIFVSHIQFANKEAISNDINFYDTLI